MDNSFPFRMLSSVDAETSVVAVAGELDIQSARPLQAVFEQAVGECRTPRLICDLSAVRFLSSSGLHVLVDASELAERAGVELVFREPSTAVRRVLEIVRVDGGMTVVPPVAPASGPAWRRTGHGRQNSA
jgi:anti-anti-sigma factor